MSSTDIIAGIAIWMAILAIGVAAAVAVMIMKGNRND